MPQKRELEHRLAWLDEDGWNDVMCAVLKAELE